MFQNRLGYYATPLPPATHPYALVNSFPSALPNHGFNPLTPPNSEPMVSPNHPEATQMAIKSEAEYSSIENDSTLTPCASPNNVDSEDDALRSLQMSMQNHALLSIPSTSPSNHSMDDDARSDTADPDEDHVPKINSHGKVKTYTCKQCKFVGITKNAYWEHIEIHMNPEKILRCHRCKFVTEYKHHLEYHLRNHSGSKPFKCDQCSYSCVNKSMLNSHLKSHSNVYQYRCLDCNYATKYCHSLKLHLRRHGHKPDIVLNPDGTPNPLPIIDVYGTRRGPKLKTVPRQEQQTVPTAPSQQQHQAFQHSLAQFMMNAQLPFPYPFLGGFPLAANPLLALQFARNQEAVQAQAPLPAVPSEPENSEPQVLDLSKTDDKPTQSEANNFEEDSSLHAEEEDTTSEPKEQAEDLSNNNGNTNCRYCDIAFGDVVLYTMHMGYHGYNDPFTCNMCGEQCKDKVSFFLHIARNSHS